LGLIRLKKVVNGHAGFAKRELEGTQYSAVHVTSGFMRDAAN